MSGSLAPFALLSGGDSWSRSAHQHTFLEMASGVVELAWSAPDDGAAPEGPAPKPGGLAFDTECRLYTSDPDAGTVTRALWRAGTPYASPAATELFSSESPPDAGDFVPAGPRAGPLN